MSVGLRALRLLSMAHYHSALKRAATEYAIAHGVMAACRKYHVPRNRVRSWLDEKGHTVPLILKIPKEHQFRVILKSRDSLEGLWLLVSLRTTRAQPTYLWGVELWEGGALVDERWARSKALALRAFKSEDFDAVRQQLLPLSDAKGRAALAPPAPLAPAVPAAASGTAPGPRST